MLTRIKRLILDNPLNLIYLVWWNLRTLVQKIQGYKTIVYNVHFDYFYDMFEPVYERLRNEKRIKVYFSYRRTNSIAKKYLQQKVNKRLMISNYISPFVYFDMFITAEINGPDFPISIFPTKKIQMYHGTGIYPLMKKRDVLSRFDIHFAVGPQVRSFILSLPYHKKKGDNLREIGFPKLDAILHPPDGQSEMLIEKYETTGKFVILYTPHWNEFGSLHCLGLDMISKVAQIDQNVLILVKVHNYLFTKYREQNWRQKLQELESKHQNILIVKRPNTQEIYPLGDVLISDTGTTSPLEYSITGKPLFVYYNPIWFQHNEHTEVESEVIKTAITFRETNQICDYIKSMLNSDSKIMKEIDLQKQKQRKLIGKFLYNPGNASPLACKVIKEELNINDTKS